MEFPEHMAFWKMTLDYTQSFMRMNKEVISYQGRSVWAAVHLKRSLGMEQSWHVPKVAPTVPRRFQVEVRD